MTMFRQLPPQNKVIGDPRISFMKNPFNFQTFCKR